MKIKIETQKTKDYAIAQIQKLSFEPIMQVEIKEFKKNRTLAQNRLMHKWFAFIDKVWSFESTGKAVGEEGWKWFFKDLYLGYKSVELPNGKVITQLKSTADASTKELSEFLEKIEAHCINEFELMLPRPEDLYYEAMGK